MPQSTLVNDVVRIIGTHEISGCNVEYIYWGGKGIKRNSFGLLTTHG